MPKDGVDWKAEEKYLDEIGYEGSRRTRKFFPIPVPRAARLATLVVTVPCVAIELFQGRWVDAGISALLVGLSFVLTRPRSSRFW